MVTLRVIHETNRLRKQPEAKETVCHFLYYYHRTEINW